MPRRRLNGTETALDLYTRFIDLFVEIRKCVASARVRRRQKWPDSPENESVNEFLGTLTSSERETLAVMLQQAKDSGIHDALVVLSEELNLEGLRLVQNGCEIPVEPFGTELYYDWVCRREGENWPKPK